jgi:hypothetical protein
MDLIIENDQLLWNSVVGNILVFCLREMENIITDSCALLVKKEASSLCQQFAYFKPCGANLKEGYTQMLELENKIKQTSLFSTISSASSIRSSTSEASSDSSTTIYSKVFWGQFSRNKKKEKEKSMFAILKGRLLRKEKQGTEAPASQTFKTSPTHPPGLYCVIDDFLSTYSTGTESEYEACEEYGEVVDTVDKEVKDECEYSEILGARHYQNLADIQYEENEYIDEESVRNLIKNNYILLEEYETAVD